MKAKYLKIAVYILIDILLFIGYYPLHLLHLLLQGGAVPYFKKKRSIML